MPSDTIMTLGMRQNNPGNLRAGFGLEYRVPVLNGFAQYRSLLDGVTSYFHDMSVKFVSDRLVTLPQYIQRYAPPDENATNAYIMAMARRLGLNPLSLRTQSLELSDHWRAIDFARAQFAIEQGPTPENWPHGREWVSISTMECAISNIRYWQSQL